MAAFEIEWKPSAIKELRRLDKASISRIVQSVDDLSSNHLPSGVRKLRGGEHSYRIRAGNYRIVYTFFKKQSVIQIARILHRRDVYRT